MNVPAAPAVYCGLCHNRSFDLAMQELAAALPLGPVVCPGCDAFWCDTCFAWTPGREHACDPEFWDDDDDDDSG